MGLFINFTMDKFLTPSPKGNFLDKFQQSAKKARTTLTPKRIFEEVQQDSDTSDIKILSDTETTSPGRKKKKPNPSRAKSGMNLIPVFVGLTTRSTLHKLFEAGDISSSQVDKFYNGVRAFYTKAMEYATKNLPLDDLVMTNSTWINLSTRLTSSIDEVLYFVQR